MFMSEVENRRMQPADERIDEIILRTAKFLNSSNDPQMEIVIQAKQANNPSFAFLNKDDPLNAYFNHVRVQLRIGLFTYGASDEGESSEDKESDDNGRVKSEKGGANEMMRSSDAVRTANDTLDAAVNGLTVPEGSDHSVLSVDSGPRVRPLSQPLGSVV
jgi:hypothetical protein